MSDHDWYHRQVAPWEAICCMRLLCGALVQAGEMQIQQVALSIMYSLLAEAELTSFIVFAILHRAAKMLEPL